MRVCIYIYMYNIYIYTYIYIHTRILHSLYYISWRTRQLHRHRPSHESSWNQVLATSEGAACDLKHCNHSGSAMDCFGILGFGTSQLGGDQVLVPLMSFFPWNESEYISDVNSRCLGMGWFITRNDQCGRFETMVSQFMISSFYRHHPNLPDLVGWLIPVPEWLKQQKHRCRKIIK